MDFNNPAEMLEMIGSPVEVDILPLNKKAKVDTSISGNIIAIDPDSNSLGLLQFHKNQPSHVVYIPGASIKEVHDLADGPFGEDLNYQQHSVEVIKFIEDNFVKKEKADTSNEAEIEERRQKLMKFLDACSLQYSTETDGTFVVGAVKIRPPYSEDTCFSENQLALGRLRKLIGQAFL